MTFVHYNPILKKRAAELRKNSTKGEIILWVVLKGRQFHGYDFHRQKPIGNYIVDFYCPELELVLEIDGMSHYQKYEYDQKRQKDLEAMGLFVLRFTEGDVCGNLDGVLIALEEWVRENGSR